MLFVCLHGSAKSLIALEHFRRLAVAETSGERESYFTRACELFEKATALEPDNGHSYGLWALAVYERGRYAKAWEKVHKAQELRAVIPEKFLRMLRAKMAEPKRP